MLHADVSSYMTEIAPSWPIQIPAANVRAAACLLLLYIRMYIRCYVVHVFSPFPILIL